MKDKEKEISEGMQIAGLGLWVKEENALVIGDLHLGYEEMMNMQGILIPRINFEKIKEELRKMFETVKVKKIIINGDLKHEFRTISKQEWSEVIEILEFLRQNCEKVILVKGNHDTVLGPIAKWEAVKVREEYFFGKEKILVLHGHKLSESKEFEKAKRVIIAHEHPAVSLRESGRREKFKCFLKGRFKGKELIVLPSLNFVTEGTNIRLKLNNKKCFKGSDVSNVLQEKLLSPFLQQDLNEFECWLVADKTYYFGRLEEIN